LAKAETNEDPRKDTRCDESTLGLKKEWLSESTVGFLEKVV
jgi:hypothetical protein